MLTGCESIYEEPLPQETIVENKNIEEPKTIENEVIQEDEDENNAPDVIPVEASPIEIPTDPTTPLYEDPLEPLKVWCIKGTQVEHSFLGEGVVATNVEPLVFKDSEYCHSKVGSKDIYHTRYFTNVWTVENGIEEQYIDGTLQ